MDTLENTLISGFEGPKDLEYERPCVVAREGDYITLSIGDFKAQVHGNALHLCKDGCDGDSVGGTGEGEGSSPSFSFDDDYGDVEGDESE